MQNSYHTFFIPVMGTGHSADTPIRVAPLGISSVVSLVDDYLLDRIGRYYAEKYGLSYPTIPAREKDGRAKRITAYLNAVHDIVQRRMEAIKALPFFEDNYKRRYFELLPDDIPLKRDYQALLQMKAGPARDRLARDLTHRMRPGSIDVNIMVKVDRVNYDAEGNELGSKFTDALAALRGYARSKLRSSVVLSAGINRRLFSHMTEFADFYRDEAGAIKKKIVIKVSDFRSARIQGRFLARKGLEVHEFRVESGLNCGGHAFPAGGMLLPSLLQEFKDKRDQLAAQFQPQVAEYYTQQRGECPQAVLDHRPLITVQGGIGTHGEMRRLLEDFKMDMTGWATPFLLVPEATCVDDTTRELLVQAGEGGVYISDVSPLNIPFINLRGTGSEIWTRKRVEAGKPGSPCIKGFACLNTEYEGRPLCISSRQYQKRKLQEIAEMDLPEEEKEHLRAQVVKKTCICDHLGNGALIALGLAEESEAPQAMCPGPNIVWFDRTYSLQEMVDHIYGRSPSLAPAERPHMFAQEAVLNVDFFEKQLARASSEQEIASLEEMADNLRESMEYCWELATERPYEDENLDSIRPCIAKQRERLNALCAQLKAPSAVSGG
ncbi:MAG: hypothetical protein U9R48_06430 [Chloroflexota bacterium]|nr:hypothetical protein [Chloroflexota bacterium]